MTESQPSDIAIVGMAARLPGAATLGEFWANLSAGLSSIRRFSEAELLAAGERPEMIARPDYVPFGAPLEGFDQFDAEFFGLSPKEAAVMDPQHRLFLEVAWEALETAGHPPEGLGPVGVFAGSGQPSYYWENVLTNAALARETGRFLLRHTGNDKDFLSTRLSHVLDLKGPSVNLQTACSTSLVATHYASQALLLGECDLALAGGVTVELPQGRGYIYREGEVLSPDGACHAFDHRAQGTVFGSGAAVLALRRREDALADGDTIWAVIKGSAINNDGAAKAGYLAPSVEGQAAVVREAQAMAGVRPESIGYVECHGTGTYLGDPIEVAGLAEAFGPTGGTTLLGSLKTNIGHLDTAAGAASLIKTALALHQHQIPPSLGYEAPNPAIGFEGTPFRVADRLSDWPQTGGPHRAGVTSLGVGGTNAHLVLEEAPAVAEGGETGWPFLPLVLSARSNAALDDASARLAAHLRAAPHQSLADIAFTLKEGRRAFEKRRVVVAGSHEEAAALLEAGDRARVYTHTAVPGAAKPVFMFPGGGSQSVAMGRDLYETEPVFADWMDRGLALIERDEPRIREIWLGTHPEAQSLLRKPSLQLPLIFTTEIALARLWMGWGVTPDALIGHSVGENVAACLAGVFSYEDAHGLVSLRGRLMDGVAPGGMLSVNLPAEALGEMLGGELDIAAINGADLTVASGPAAALAKLEARLSARGVEYRRIGIDIAAHSRLLEPVLGDFRAYLASIELNAPQIPVISNRTALPLTEEEAQSPDYWVSHLREAVRFHDGLSHLGEDPSHIFIQVGPGRGIAQLAGQHRGIGAGRVTGTLPEAEGPEDRHFLTMLARVWAMGGEIDWQQVWGDEPRRRLPLPTYPWQHQRYFIEPGQRADETPALPMREAETAKWGWQPAWRPDYAPCEADLSDLSTLLPTRFLLFADEAGLAEGLAARLRAGGHPTCLVHPGDAFAEREDGDFTLAPERGREGYDALLARLAERGERPERIGHFWLVTEGERFRPGSSFFHRVQEQGFWSLFHLAQALAEEGSEAHLMTFTTGAAAAPGESVAQPAKATVFGPARVIPREMAVTSATVDLALPRRKADRPALEARLLEELFAEPQSAEAVLRGERRWRRAWRPAPLGEAAELPRGAHVLVTGGLGGMGLTLAEAMMRRHGARVTLISRSALPDRAEWPAILRNASPTDRLARRLRRIEALEALGEVAHIAADVANLEDMRAARAEAEGRFGPVTTVLHAAGVMDDAPIAAKSPLAVEEVLAPKLHGADVLRALFKPGELGRLILCASTSAAIGPAGQADYAAANAYLDALAASGAFGATKVTAIDWGIWQGTGMAAESMAARTPAPAPEAPAGQPLLTTATFDAAGHRRFTGAWTARHWALGEHRTATGEALLPGTGYLELAAEALAAQGEHGPYELADLTFLAPLRVPDEGETRVAVTLRRSDAGYAFAVESALPGGGFAPNAEGEIALLPMSAPPPLDIPALEAALPAPERAPVGSHLPSPQAANLRFGPRWDAVTERRMGQGEGLARLRLPPAARADSAYALHPALMDMATGWAVDLAPGFDGSALWVPVSYDSVRVHDPLPAELVSHVRLAAGGDDSARFDITLAAPDGAVAVEIEGFSMRRLAGGFRFPAPVPETSAGPAPLSPGEERLRHMLSQGIRPEEGAELFFRALGTGAPQIAVSSMPLPALIAAAARQEAPEASQAFARPSLESDFAAPETEVEKRLAAMWRELLGIEEVGVDDGFFDLGGHSLIAVRLFAQIRKAFAVDMAMSVLFEAPTIRGLSALIEAKTGPAPAEAAEEEAPKPRRRFTHIVPMHEGEGGAKTPFFLVAGMFGNVLNLRHLAQLLGADRPFYGLQAKGLMGDDAPHETIGEAATAMIAEMRALQPRGPYMVGGFSGGGLTAYEIAQQLTAAGEEVSSLVLLDTPLPQRTPLTRRDRAMIQWLELKGQGPLYPVRWASRRVAWEFEKRRPREDNGQGFHNAAIEAAFLRAAAAWRPAPWEGPMALFRPALTGKWQVAPGRLVSHERAYVTEDNGWRPMVPRLEVFEVPGDHDSMVLEPNVRVLAARMARVVAAAEQPARARRRAWPVGEAAE
ncbi:type I polyketide synthase [Pseudoroseicyclus tamaricis]|uniref:SDR family NAD(P)-dependent oxidoreductase n=1 Tax=Pseudoroseicyclus tamaricis TaxID=2705421 RepID=A0A6B2JNB4_9RHOB|nr:type I polyketide synthase [Pseudoroseicyclus tamaricis]NDU99469.1 SDR family NAD(P)-dependent oxidoreductase [Pseudoroseicyclus tamaricis]